MKINPHIFREYDIRGNVGTDLSDEFAHILGRAYASLLSEKGLNNVGIGWDTRLSSEGYALALAKGISEGGLDVQLTGMGPTPQLYFALFQRNLGGGIQVTGSHNPPDMNGFKVCVGTHTLSGADIQDIKQRALKISETSPSPAARIGAITECPIRDEYTKTLIDNSKTQMGTRKLKVVVDAGNGVGGLVGPTVLRSLGVEVVELFCEPDGRFPNHHPDPTVLENILTLAAKVKETKADFGIGWDGDADRIGVVDEMGNPIFGDMFLLICAREILKEKPGSTFIADVKSSSRLFSDIKARGGNPIMWKTGHSLIKGKLRETGGELAGEMSGHVFFKHRYYGFDDALYSSCRFAEIVSKTNKPVSQLLSDLPHMTATPEIRVDCPEEVKFKIPELMKKAFSSYKVETVDGARINFEHGWGLVRASNTQPILVLRFEAENDNYLSQYQKVVTDKLDEIKRELES